MADDVDLANDYADEFLQRALARRALEKRQREANATSGTGFCVDCDDAIPLLRQQAVQGCETCISCEELRERRR